MRGQPQHGFPAFLAAEEWLRLQGWDTANPARHSIENGYDPRTESREPEPEEVQSFFAWDLAQIMGSEVTDIVLLPGWESSVGARIEFLLAKMFGKNLWYLVGPETDERGELLGFGNEDGWQLIEYVAGDSRFHLLINEMAALHDRKQCDYGTDGDPFANVRASEQFGVSPWVGALIRLNDKVTRLKSFAQKGALANESAEDSMLDIAVYALISLILYREEAVDAKSL